MRVPTVRQFREMNPVPIGAAFIVFVLLLLWAAFNITHLPLLGGGTKYTAAFSEAAGLRKGDKVRIAGIAVGQVTNVGLEGSHVKVSFLVDHDGVHLGRGTTASIQIFTLLGNKYLALEPAGPGRWNPQQELPLRQTTAPYDVEPAFQDLTRTVSQIDSTQLAKAFDTLATTFRNSPPALRSALQGLSRLSQTIASRDQQLTELLQHAHSLSGVLASRREQITQLFGDGDLLLRMLERRQQVISELFTNTSTLAQQLTGLVKDNQAQLKPALTKVTDVLNIINAHQGDLVDFLQRLYVFTRGEIDAIGNGPWFDGIAANVTNPVTIGNGQAPGTIGRSARTIGELLGVGQAIKAVSGK